jgi:hypothetical protein
LTDQAASDRANFPERHQVAAHEECAKRSLYLQFLKKWPSVTSWSSAAAQSSSSGCHTTAKQLFRRYFRMSFQEGRDFADKTSITMHFCAEKGVSGSLDHISQINFGIRLVHCSKTLEKSAFRLLSCWIRKIVHSASPIPGSIEG